MRRALRTLAATLLATAAVVSHGRAQAGGFEFPDNGTEALGRGAAFTAKADDPTAVQYNLGGLARQRGTHLLLNGNLNFHSFSFQRAGTYADDPRDPATPWGGHRYPVDSDKGPAFFAPFLALTTDLGYFDRLTFAVAAFGPSAVGGRTFQLGVQGAPGPGRYDSVQSSSSLVYPTVAAAYRATSWLDVGVGGSLVLGQFDTTSVSFSDLSPTLCPRSEYQPCDSRSQVKTSGMTFAPSVGVLARPTESVALGLNIRAAHTLDTSGTVSATPPAVAASIPIEPGTAHLQVKLPWVVRAGARYIAMKNGTESFDVELDGTYETWGSAQGDGPTIDIPKLGPYSNIHSTVTHGYMDTFSVRGGGAYNTRALGGVFTVRGGAYFDSSATDGKYTRIDMDTLAKAAITAGLGLKSGPVAVNLAFAEVFELTRTVSDGVIRPINPSAGGASTGPDGKAFPAVNNGVYAGHMHILSIGVTVAFDELFGDGRKAVPMNEWERENSAPSMPSNTQDEEARQKSMRAVSSGAPKWEDAPAAKKPDTWKPTRSAAPMQPEPEPELSDHTEARRSDHAGKSPRRPTKKPPTRAGKGPAR
jgi:long-chain fatty acid transport protein